MDGWMDGWVGGWVCGWMGGWVDGWVGGWMDGWIGASHKKPRVPQRQLLALHMYTRSDCVGCDACDQMRGNLRRKWTSIWSKSCQKCQYWM